MSKITLSSNASGTGTLTIASPNTSTDRTLTLPDSTGTMATNEAIAAAGYTTSSEVLTQFNASGSAPVYACRAWVNFNGTGTVAIRASGNVSSITDNGVGDYTVNFTTAMPDADYLTVVSNSPTYGGTATNLMVLYAPQRGAGNWAEQAPTTSAFRTASAGVDNKYICIAIFR